MRITTIPSDRTLIVAMKRHTLTVGRCWSGTNPRRYIRTFAPPLTLRGIALGRWGVIWLRWHSPLHHVEGS